jgi:ABC-type uncharacterized transport system permease subunit
MATRPNAPVPKAAKAGPAASPPPADAARPLVLRLAAAAQAAEAAGLCVAAVFSAISTADGRSYQRASGVALTLIAFGTAALLALLAVGLAKAKPWSRTPAVMTQLFVGGAGIYLLEGRRYDWGVPTLAVAVICLAAVLSPPAFRALNRPARP